MIQRIQSVYLLLTAILMAVTVFSPFIEIPNEPALCFFYRMDASNHDSYSNLCYFIWIAGGLAAISALVAFLSIFAYKNRKKQIMTCYINLLIIVLFYATLAAFLYMLQQTVAISLSWLKYGIILPVIAVILNQMAITKIKSDEKLVQSLNRIR